jgi:hypothetical protein
MGPSPVIESGEGQVKMEPRPDPQPSVILSTTRQRVLIERVKNQDSIRSLPARYSEKPSGSEAGERAGEIPA